MEVMPELNTSLLDLNLQFWHHLHQSDPDSVQYKALHDSESLPVVQQQTHIRLISWSKPIRDSEVRTPPLIGHGPDIPVRVCTFENACAAAVRQRERWVVEMRTVLPT